MEALIVSNVLLWCLLIALAFAVLGLVRQIGVLHGRLAPAGALIPLGLILPRVLAPLYKGWMAVGHVLGWINTRIILGILYYGLVVPMGLVMKMLGRDPMRRAWIPGMDTYRVVREPRPPSHMKNMF